MLCYELFARLLSRYAFIAAARPKRASMLFVCMICCPCHFAANDMAIAETDPESCSAAEGDAVALLLPRCRGSYASRCWRGCCPDLFRMLELLSVVPFAEGCCAIAAPRNHATWENARCSILVRYAARACYTRGGYYATLLLMPCCAMRPAMRAGEASS